MADREHRQPKKKAAPAAKAAGIIAMMPVMRGAALAAARVLLPLAEAYLGDAAKAPPQEGEAADPAAATAAAAANRKVGKLPSRDRRLLELALHKLLYEAGELLVANYPVTPDKSLPEFQRDPQTGSFPALNVGYAVAGAKAWTAFRDARAEKQKAQAAERKATAAQREAEQAEGTVDIIPAGQPIVMMTSAGPQRVRTIRNMALYRSRLPQGGGRR